jgi:hypothetical protein
MPNGTEAISASRGRKCAQTVGWPRTVRHSSAGGINMLMGASNNDVFARDCAPVRFASDFQR